jgi:hypothetical protein
MATLFVAEIAGFFRRKSEEHSQPWLCHKKRRAQPTMAVPQIQ